MSLKVECPWCGARTRFRGSKQATWRFRVPCDRCEQVMVLTCEDGRLAVERLGAMLPRSEDATVPFTTAR